jgi:dTDP-4-amino-4,6-dideoxygalactose transaminase
MNGVAVPFREFSRGTPTWHIMPILLDKGIDRQGVIASLKSDGVQSSIHYPAIQDFTAYKNCDGETPLANEVCRRELTLPLYPTMTDAEVDLVCDSLRRAVEAQL